MIGRFLAPKTSQALQLGFFELGLAGNEKGRIPKLLAMAPLRFPSNSIKDKFAFILPEIVQFVLRYAFGLFLLLLLANCYVFVLAINKGPA